MSVHLQRQIERLKKAVLSLGGLAEESVVRAIQAVKNGDPVLAKAVIDGDERIDQMEIDVEEECLHTLALHQPVAFDLRFVVAVLKINSDLERIADLAVNMAEQCILLSQADRVPAMPFDLTAMGNKVRSMLNDALNALVNMDSELAQSVRATDDEVDLMHRQMYERVEKAIHENRELAPQLIQMLNVSRHLERIADHAVNVADDVMYMAKGDILRHNRPHPLLGPHGEEKQ